MRFCIYCGTKHAEDDRFCPNCGKPVFDINAFEKDLAIPNPQVEEVIEETPVVEEPVIEETPVIEEVEEAINEEVAPEVEEAPEETIEEPVPEEIEEPVVELPPEEPVEEPVIEEETPAPVEEPKQEEIPVPIEEPQPSIEEEAILEEKPEKDLKVFNILLVFISLACLVAFYGLAYLNDNFHFFILGSAVTALINLILSIIKKAKKKTPSHKLFYSAMIALNIIIILSDSLFFLEYIR